MLDNDGYAGKKRKKPVQKQKPAADAIKSNPSKRHRDRLNCELDRLTNMLPFPENVCSRLDKLSVLRLSVGYLKVKSFFNATVEKKHTEFPTENGLETNCSHTTASSEGDLLLQALDGFVLVVTTEGYVFYASPTIQDYLGFHQTDVVYQSVFEFIHVEDRAVFRQHLHFALNPKLFSADKQDHGIDNSSDITRNVVTYDPQYVPPENSSFLERNFVCRFRCLLDNSSGFLKLNFQGRLKFLHGQRRKTEDGALVQPQLALFAIATPVQTPAILEIRMKTLIFQTKHKLDFTPIGIDSRGKIVLGYTEMELCMRGSGYQFIHAADMMYCADNHVKMIKTGESGMTVFRLLTKTGEWVWVQANARLVYKGGRPDFIIARQRALVNAEGEEHLRQRSAQLPFSLATGEAVLYTPPSLDTTHPKTIPNRTGHKASDPASILDCMQSQEKSIYQRPSDTPFTADDAFLDSWALFNVPSHPFQGESVKEEDTVASVMNALEHLAKDGDLCTALQQMDVDSTELKDWEEVLLSLTKDSRGSDKVLGLDEIFSNDIFASVEDALSMETSKFVPSQPVGPITTESKGDLLGGHSGQLSASTTRSGCEFNPDMKIHTKLDSVGMANSLFQEVVPKAAATENTRRLSHASPNSAISVPWHQEDSQNLSNNLSYSDQTGLITCDCKDPVLFGQKNWGLKATPGIYSSNPSSSLELQKNTPNGIDEGKVQRNAGSSYQFGPHPVNQTQNLQINHSQNQPAVNNWNKMTLGTETHSPSPYNSCVPPEMNHGYTDLSRCSQQGKAGPFQQWLQSQAGQLGSSPVKSTLTSECCFQALENPGFPLGVALPESSQSCSVERNNLLSDMYHSPPDRLNANLCSPLSDVYPALPDRLRADPSMLSDVYPPPPDRLKADPSLLSDVYPPTPDRLRADPSVLSDVYPPPPDRLRADPSLLSDVYPPPPDRLRADPWSPLSSCMFGNQSPLTTNADQLQPQAQAVSISTGRYTRPSNNSPPQASCYFQWTHNEPVVGTCSIPQEDACISPPSSQTPSGIAHARRAFQRFLGCKGQSQVDILPIEDGSFCGPTLAKGMNSNCCNL